MALHIQMTPEAEATLKRKLLRSKLSAIAACLGFVLAGGAALYLVTIVIAGNELPAFSSYEPPPSNKPPTKKPRVQELSSKSSPPSSSVAPPVIVSTASSNVVMAISDIPTTEFGIGMSNDIGSGLGGDGIGDGLGDGPGGMGSGDSGGSTLEGTFYDFKQTKSGASTGITPNSTNQILSLYNEFFTGGWNERTFSKYYKSPTKLYSGVFMLPTCKAEYAPHAFKCSDKVQPSAWGVIYRGKIVAPATGKFRFVGIADDVMAVRFNRKMVLEAGWSVPTINQNNRGLGSEAGYRNDVVAGKHPSKAGYKFLNVPGIPKWNNELGGLTAGDTFSVREGQTYPIEIFISEIPGGAFGFALLIEDVTDGEKGAGNLQLFRTDMSTPTAGEVQKLLSEAGFGGGGLEWPQYSSDSLIWVAKP